MGTTNESQNLPSSDFQKMLRYSEKGGVSLMKGLRERCVHVMRAVLLTETELREIETST